MSHDRLLTTTSLLAITLVIAGTRTGYVVLVLASLLAAVIPVVHLSGAGVGGKIAGSSGGFFFIWTLIALGVTGTFSLVLSMCGLWRLRRGQPATSPDH